nr:JmjC domain-containing protein [Tanacetum cinerariifolium]
MACQIIQKKQEEKKIEEEQAANARYWKILACCDDDNNYNSAITPNELVDSLSIGDEHLDTILATKSDEFIKSCVENLVPNPSESEGENGCDVPACFTNFSNILFDADYESDSGDYQSSSDEDLLKEIFLNPLFQEEINSIRIDRHPVNDESDLIEYLLNCDSSIISSSSKTDSLLDEFADKLILLKSIPSRIDETDCYHEEDIRLIERLLYDNSSLRPSKEFVFENANADIKSFSSSPILVEDSDSRIEEIDLTFTLDDPMPPGIEDDDDDSERDILIHEELLDNYSLSLPVTESFLFDIPSFTRPPAKPPDGNTRILNIKMMGDIPDRKSHETDAGPFTTVEDAPMGGDFHTSPLRSSQAPPAGCSGEVGQKGQSIGGQTEDQEKENGAVTVDSNIPSSGTSQIPAASLRVSTAGPPGTFDIPPGTFDVPLGTSDVPTSALTVPAGSPNVPTDVSSSAASAGVSSKGKSPMVEEDIHVKARTFKQMEEDKLGEEAAKRLHDKEIAQLERQRAEVQRKRQQDVIDSAMYYNEADWLNIRDQVEANASLSKTLLGDDVFEDNFPARMAALIKWKRQAMAEHLAKEKHNRPMTQA